MGILITGPSPFHTKQGFDVSGLYVVVNFVRLLATTRSESGPIQCSIGVEAYKSRNDRLAGNDPIDIPPSLSMTELMVNQSDFYRRSFSGTAYLAVTRTWTSQGWICTRVLEPGQVDPITFSYDASGFNFDGFNYLGFNRAGYNSTGYNAQGYNAQGYNALGYNVLGYNSNGYNVSGYNAQGYAPDGYTAYGINSSGDLRPFANTGISSVMFGLSTFEFRVNFSTLTFSTLSQQFSSVLTNTSSIKLFQLYASTFYVNVSTASTIAEYIQDISGNYPDISGTYNYIRYNAMGYDAQGYDPFGYAPDGYNSNDINRAGALRPFVNTGVSSVIAGLSTFEHRVNIITLSEQFSTILTNTSSIKLFQLYASTLPVYLSTASTVAEYIQDISGAYPDISGTYNFIRYNAQGYDVDGYAPDGYNVNGINSAGDLRPFINTGVSSVVSGLSTFEHRLNFSTVSTLVQQFSTILTNTSSIKLFQLYASTTPIYVSTASTIAEYIQDISGQYPDISGSYSLARRGSYLLACSSTLDQPKKPFHMYRLDSNFSLTVAPLPVDSERYINIDMGVWRLKLPES